MFGLSDILDAVKSVSTDIKDVANADENLKKEYIKLEVERTKLELAIHSASLKFLENTQNNTNEMTKEQNSHERFLIQNDLKYLVVIKYFIRLLLSLSMMGISYYIYNFTVIENFNNTKEVFLIVVFMLGLMLFSERLSASLIGIISRFIDNKFKNK